MAVTVEQFVAELRAFDGRRTVVQTLRRRLRSNHRAQVRKTRAAWVDGLPSTNGLGQWVARATITLRIRYSGRTTGIDLRGSRKSGKGKADLAGIDRGRVRAPSWGRKGAGQWHTQTVTPKLFTNSVDIGDWVPTIDAAFDEALGVIRG